LEKTPEFLIVSNVRFARIATVLMDWLTPELFWFLLGFLLLVAEFVLPGIIIVFFGIGAWIAAFTTWIGLTESTASQNIVFVISSVILLFVLRHRFKNAFVGTSTNDAIEDEYTGKEARTLTDIDDQQGKIEMKGAEWNARSIEPIAANAWVIIERREGLTLHVRPR
jgi:membrane protein implicated in regulation of membrane protease activity